AAVRYINALPLIYGLSEIPTVELSFETPAVCYRKLIDHEVDVGLIPVVGLQMDQEIRALKGLGIAAANRSDSVIVFSRKPLDRVATVLTDSSSLTSVMLLQLVLRLKYKNNPVFQSGPIGNIHEALREHDAVLVIGDAAILAEKTDYDHYDLATEWYSMTSLPFVFAVWGCNRVLSPEETEILHSAYKHATGHWQDIYTQAQSTLPVSSDFLKRYYNHSLHYRLTRSDYEGLLKFMSLAAESRLTDNLRKDIWM